MKLLERDLEDTYEENCILKRETSDKSDLVEKSKFLKLENRELKTNIDRLRTKYHNLKQKCYKLD